MTQRMHHATGRRQVRTLGALMIAATAFVVPASASADAPTASRGPAAASPAPAVDPVAEAVPIQGSDLVRGKAKIVVHAPMHLVRQRILAFNEYAEFMPHYNRSKDLGRGKNGSRNVYMEVYALRGAARMWARMSVAKAQWSNGVQTYDVSFIEGNVRDFHATWRMRQVDPAHTELELEVFLQPKLPLPASLLNRENMEGAVKGVVAMRNRIEQSRQVARR
ncbi:SRPBCC family protein [Polyangium aurulentum]|uniref:SRPBCC family protein n=1 Tax=Polyangium aurulentum TaxID=2567896 RepID=UPI0010AE2571|nr:SRPBCC family protein [Polyangium aurulentum]UQA56409.1 SRPBCC family protein [Polyangium aurulentum]